MYYKIPLNADLSETSYRALKDTEDCAYIDYNEGYIGENWEEISETDIRELVPEWFEVNVVEEPTEPTNAELAQQIADLERKLTENSVTFSSVDEAIAEGVNDV